MTCKISKCEVSLRVPGRSEPKLPRAWHLALSNCSIINDYLTHNRIDVKVIFVMTLSHLHITNKMSNYKTRFRKQKYYMITSDLGSNSFHGKNHSVDL